MKNSFTRTYILLAVLLLLGGYVYFFHNTAEDTKRADSDRPRFSQSLIDELRVYELESFGEKIVLSHKNDVWSASHFEEGDESKDIEDSETYIVDEVKMESFLTLLSTFPKGTLVSRSPERWAEFGVSGKEKITGFINAVPSFEILVGESDQSGHQRYMRSESDDRTFLVPVSLRSFLGQSIEQWVDRSLFTPDFDQLSEFVVKIEDDKRVFRKLDGSWKLVDSFEEFDEEMFKEYVDKILEWRASSVSFDSENFDSGLFRAKVFVSFDDATRTIALNIREHEGGLYAQIENEELVYRLDSTVLEQAKGDWFEGEVDPVESTE